MKANIVAFVGGIVFAAGLGISGMTMPSKIVGFLDVAGAWDLSLAFVMVGAIAVYSIGFRLALRRAVPVFSTGFSIPKPADIDRRLILGSALFGIGWGIGGFCPGPAIVSLAWTSEPVVIFVVAMVLGMYLHSIITSPRTTSARARVPVAVPTIADS